MLRPEGEKYNLTNGENKVFISIVSYAEILSLAKQLNWGKSKLDILANTLKHLPILYLNMEITKKYVEIDVYSQGKDFRQEI